MRRSTEQEYRERMYKVLEHIQANLDQPPSLEKLAAISFFSPFHFHRIFKGMIGEPLLQYVKRLRLEKAAVQLKLTDRPVTQIAFDAGYEAHEAFTRAFKVRFRLTPSAYRQQHRPPDGAPDGATETSDDSGAIRMPSDIVFAQEDSPMQVEIRMIEPVRVAYIRHVGPYPEIGNAYSKLFMWAMGKRLLGPFTQTIGLSYDDPQVTSADQLRSDACLSVGDAVQAEGEIGVKVVGGVMCAVMMHKGPYEKLDEAYERLLGKWFPRSDYEPDVGPCLEFYKNNPQVTPPDELLTQVCVPLMK